MPAATKTKAATMFHPEKNFAASIPAPKNNKAKPISFLRISFLRLFFGIILFFIQ